MEMLGQAPLSVVKAVQQPGPVKVLGRVKVLQPVV
jgi:hypothetical protein